MQRDLFMRNHAWSATRTFSRLTLSVNGGNAHLFYTTSKDPLNCINCHISVGHYDRNAIHAHDTRIWCYGTSKTETLFTEPAKVEKFETFREMIPGTNVSFDMVAIPGGTFNMGSPENEPFRKPDEGPGQEGHSFKILDSQN